VCSSDLSTTTEEGVVKGKLAYMSPEQLGGQRALDRRTDVFALGVVLWELLTGQRLFRGQAPQETLSNVLHAPILAPSEVDPSLPSELDPIVLRALSRPREDRFASARELASAIVRSGVPIAEAHEVGALMETRFGATLRARRTNLLRAADASGSMASMTPTPPASVATVPESSAVQRIARGTSFSVLHRRKGAVAAGVIALLAIVGVAAAWLAGAPSSPPPTAPSANVTSTPPSTTTPPASTTTAHAVTTTPPSTSAGEQGAQAEPTTAPESVTPSSVRTTKRAVRRTTSRQTSSRSTPPSTTAPRTGEARREIGRAHV
jgi:serine/threonine-protein kinase